MSIFGQGVQKLVKFEFLEVNFWPFYLVKIFLKTLNTCRKWNRQFTKMLRPFLESPNPPLKTANRYKVWHNSLYLSYLIQNVNFVSTLFSNHEHLMAWLYTTYYSSQNGCSFWCWWKPKIIAFLRPSSYSDHTIHKCNVKRFFQKRRSVSTTVYCY